MSRPFPKSTEEEGHHANSVKYNDFDDEKFEEVKDVNALSNQEDVAQFKVKYPDDDNPRCRICWEEAYSAENPMISACICRGIAGLYHLSCLRKWLDTNKQSKTDENYQSFYWRTFECEVCKTGLPFTIRINGERVPLVQYESPE